MIEFLRRLWELTRPYRGRLLLAILTGVIGGLIEPLMVATIVLVYSLIFPTGAATAAGLPQLAWAPQFVQEWAESAQQSLAGGPKMRPAVGIASPLAT